ncbi:hypothetical protein Tco_0533785 [Tanacetum coccineum]
MHHPVRHQEIVERNPLMKTPTINHDVLASLNITLLLEITRIGAQSSTGMLIPLNPSKLITHYKSSQRWSKIIPDNIVGNSLSVLSLPENSYEHPCFIMWLFHTELSKVISRKKSFVSRPEGLKTQENPTPRLSSEESLYGPKAGTKGMEYHLSKFLLPTISSMVPVNQRLFTTKIRQTYSTVQIYVMTSFWPQAEHNAVSHNFQRK